MFIGVLGLNHRSTPVELREKVAFQPHQVPAALESVRRELGVSECVILSTCNRVELYTLLPEVDGHAAGGLRGVASSSDSRAAELLQFLARYHNLPESHLTQHVYWHLQPDSVRHLFRVAAGLDSMVLGESEILGQVRDAYHQAVSCGSVGSVFHRLFQTAIRTGKEVRAKTKIGQGAVSVSSVAVDLARRIFQDLRSKTILILGSGQMGETTLRCLHEQGVGSILVANRTVEAAVPLAESVGGRAVPLADLIPALIQADIVICSTSAQGYLLTQPQVRGIMAARRQKPLFLIDISVPRNLDPQIGLLENVYLYDIDDLEGISSANLQNRLTQVESCSKLIEQQIDEFLGRLSAGAARREAARS